MRKQINRGIFNTDIEIDVLIGILEKEKQLGATRIIIKNTAEPYDNCYETYTSEDKVDYGVEVKEIKQRLRSKEFKPLNKKGFTPIWIHQSKEGELIIQCPDPKIKKQIEESYKNK